MSETDRLHKFLAHCGVASRRKAETMIADGRVMVNGERVTTMGVKVSPGDRITVDGIEVREQPLITLVLHKPAGYITSLHDPQKRRTIAHLLPEMGAALKPVGRLDYDSSGLLICTSDGELAFRLGHPKYRVEKEYQVIVRGGLTDGALAQLEQGVMIEGRLTAPARVKMEAKFQASNEFRTRFRITIHEGRNRQIRQMCDAVGYPVIELKRTRIGPLRLTKLAPKQARTLSQVEVAELRRLVGLDR
jgi:23S rRNA pseudouridine2605 synthase